MRDSRDSVVHELGGEKVRGEFEERGRRIRGRLMNWKGPEGLNCDDVHLLI